MRRVLRAVRRRVALRAPAEPLDPELYRRLYPDLADMADEALQRHWREHGRAEGRLGSLAGLESPAQADLGRLPSDFTVDGYLANNDDLRAALSTVREAVGHYLNYGRREGRRYYPESPPPGATADQLAEVVARHPECVRAVGDLASVQLASGCGRDALATLGPAREAAPGDTRIVQLFVQALHAVGSHDEAFAEVARVATLPDVDAGQVATLQASGDYLRTFQRSAAQRCAAETRNRYTWATTSQVAAEISAAVNEQRGFALVTLGEHEGAYASVSLEDEERFAALYRANRTGTLAPRSAEPTGVTPSASLMTQGLQADFCCVPSAAALERAYATGDARSWSSLLNVHRWLAQNEPPPRPTLCDSDVVADLYRRGLLAPMLRRWSGLAVVAADAEMLGMLQRRLSLTGVESIVTSAEPSSGAFEALMARFAQPQVGRVYLIAAGPLGVSYAIQIKRHGGIAVDLGNFSKRWATFDSSPDGKVRAAA